MSSWYDQYAQCPYYHGTDVKTQITCDGVTDGCKLRWIFASRDHVKIQLKTFCCDRYKNCEVYQLLRQIYEDDEN